LKWKPGAKQLRRRRLTKNEGDERKPSAGGRQKRRNGRRNERRQWPTEARSSASLRSVPLSEIAPDRIPICQQMQQEDVSKKPPKPADTEKRIPQLKKQPSKVGLGMSTAATNSVKLPVSTSVKPQLATTSAGTVKLVSQSSTVPTFKKIVAPTPKSQHEKQPSKIVQAQMQARYQAQLHEEDLDDGGIDESADLPDINSAYVLLLLLHRINYLYAVQVL